MAKKVIKDLLEDAFDEKIKQISGQDATFLYAESPSSPMHIGTLTIVEGSLKFEDFKAILASKLHLMPKFRQRLLNVPLNLDYPYWVDDPNFDIDLHLKRTKLPDPANWDTLRAQTSSVFSSPLDLRRPLWSIDFIEGLDEISQIPKGSVAIITKVHHVMIDGSSGVGIMGLLFDKNEADKNKKPPAPKPYDPEPLPDELSLLLKSTYSFLKDPLKVPKTVGETLFTMIKGKASLKVKGASFNKKAYSVPKTIFNGNVSPKRTWGTAILSFERVNVLRKTMEVSINDIIVAICAGAIRTYLQEKEKLPSQPLVANVPISIRVKGEKQEMNNQISNMLVQIGTHIEDPIERLEFIHEQTDLGKTRHKAVGAKSLAKMADSVPFGLANLAAGVYSRYNIKELHRPPFNVTITNVPGPNGLLYLKGHKIVSIFGLTPVLDGFGLIIAAFSYNGQFTITATSDAKTMPDADQFSRDLLAAANELEKVILTKGKPKKETTPTTLKSTSFFTALRKYTKENTKAFSTFKGVYAFHVKSKNNAGIWQLEVTENTTELKKLKTTKAKITVEINDAILVALHQKQLLFEEVLIQGRAQFSGKEREIQKFKKLLIQFLNR